jgi:WD40 repeat protein
MSAAAGAADGFQPWLGLLPYSEADQELFFGRESDTMDLLRLVRREVVTVLFGRSGTGKSSLLKAGLFPKLRQEQFLPVWIRLDHSGRTPYGTQVRTEIERSVKSHDIEVEILNGPLADESEDVWEYLHRVVFWDAKNQPVTPVLVFDQFEELFTLGRSRPEIGGFFEELAAVAENLIPTRIRNRVVAGEAKLPAAYNQRHYKLIISLREDYVSRLDSLAKDMPSVMHNRHALTHMTGTQALEVVLKPGGDLVEETVARKIVRFVAAANDVEAIVPSEGDSAPSDLENLRTEPALLSLVCSELNLQRIKEGRSAITLEHVQRSSDQILEDFYERSLGGLDFSDRVFIEDRLVTASGFRTTVPVEEAIQAGLNDEEVEKLVARRLLRKEDRLGTPHVELTHDVLTRVVTRSRGLRREREEEEALRLKKAREESERRERKVRSEIDNLRLRKMRNRMRAIWVVIGLSTALATVAGVLLASNRKIKKANEDLDEARKLQVASINALKAVNGLEHDPEFALLLSIESAAATFPPDSRKNLKGLPLEIEIAMRTATRESLIRQRYEGHTADIYSVDFDREGRRLLTSAASADSTARIWNVDSGKEIARLDHAAMEGGKTTVSYARFSRDNKRIVTTTYRKDGEIYIWDAVPLLDAKIGSGPLVATKPLVTFNNHHARVTTAAFSPDGKMVASGGHDNMVRLWDPATGKELTEHPLARHTERIRSLSFNANGGQLLSTSDDGTAILWDLLAAQQPDAAMGAGFIRALVHATGETLHDGDLSPSGNLAATVGNDKFIRVWDVTTGLELASQIHPDSVMDVSFIDDDRLVTVCNDSAIRFWFLGNAAEENVGSSHPAAEAVRMLRLMATQRGHNGWIRDVAVSPDRRFIATCGDDRSARYWKLPPGGEVAVLGAPEFESWAADAHVAKNGRLIAFVGTKEGDVRGLDAFKERPLESWGPSGEDKIKHASEVRSVSVSPDGSQLVTGSNDQTAIVWDAVTGRPKFQIIGHQGPGGGTVYNARFSVDGQRIITASNEGCARVWNARNGDQELMLVPDRQAITLGDFKNFSAFRNALQDPASPVSAFLLSRFTEEERGQLGGPASELTSVQKMVVRVLNRIISDDFLTNETVFSRIGRPMTLELRKRDTDDRGRRILNRLLLEDAFPTALENAHIHDARFSHDGSKIVTADFDARTATLWDARAGSQLRVFPGGSDRKKAHGDNVVGAAFSQDGRQVATACTDGFCRIWNADTVELEKTLPHSIAVRSVEFGPEGKLLLTAAADGVARLWMLPDYKLRAELKGHTDTIPDARFTDEGDYIVTASRDGTTRIFQTDPWGIYSLATTRVTRKLTMKERKDYNITRELSPDEEAYYANEKAADP